ncbi:LOW QUALITY PROTEIN: G-protein coupled receptor GRL101-like [Tubulanus polymorphus]|uniref:LOW QUALITY PROTEIN: G-protein coupled receptor GRL101-like n=1 Tax=Tubulanus polymorphus TaxID=672921 RepID=UPI003DA2BE4F
MLKLFFIVLGAVLHRDFVQAIVTPPGGDESCDGFRCADGSCIHSDRKCDHVSDCVTGEDESVAQCGCLESEFQCDNITCIDINKRCDIADDCPDASDEAQCHLYICPSMRFKCANHYCLPLQKTCDFVDDCGDGSDELNCKYRPCYGNEYRCNNSECIPQPFLCDGQPFCKDGSDEWNCEKQLLCENNFYVSHTKACDGWIDCTNGEADEATCGACGDDQFACSSGRCIRKSNQCDGVCDCALRCEDEDNCGNHTLSCPLGEFYLCRNQFLPAKDWRCIGKQFMCDGINDCWNTVFGADEYFCHTECTDDQYPFKCAEGRCLPEVVRCDHINDCLNGETNGTAVKFEDCLADEFKCTNGQCIDIQFRCDAVFHCNDRSDEIQCEKRNCAEDEFLCATGQCIPNSKRCNYRRDCPDNSDEDTCPTRRECGADEFRCNNGHCVPLTQRCYKSRKTGVEPGGGGGCNDESHLIDCLNWNCSAGQYKCNRSYCIDGEYVCDGRVDCIAFDDEWRHDCNFKCPSVGGIGAEGPCKCQNENMTCSYKMLNSLPYPEFGTRHIFLAGNNLGPLLDSDTFTNKDDHKTLSKIITLDLTDNQIRYLGWRYFRDLTSLSTLILEDNYIEVVGNESLYGLKNLNSLYLAGNRIRRIEPNSFHHTQLIQLDLSGQKINMLYPGMFLGLRNLIKMNLTRNNLETVHDGAFYGLNKLQQLDLSRNEISLIEKRVFFGMTSLVHLISDEFAICCLAPLVAECEPHADAFSSCEDLMSNVVLRVMIWVIGITASAGNMVVVVWRLRKGRESKVHSFLITNLALGDLLMGVYLVIIASVDEYYRGTYAVYDKRWRYSTLCEICGFLSTFSSEISVLTLTLITIDRLICIIFPFKIKRLGLKQARVVMAILWLIVGLISAVPLMNVTYFSGFYSRSGVCLALHITPDKPNGWEYSVFVFLALNLASFSIIFVSYLWMFIVAKKTQNAVRSPEMKKDNAMAKRMTLIVMTDFCCWVPICLLGIASIGGVGIPPQVYAWIAVFVLPLNSGINPVLYTLSTAPFVKHIRKRAFRFRRSLFSTSTSFMNTATTKNSYIDETSNMGTKSRQYLMSETRYKPIDGDTGGSRLHGGRQKLKLTTRKEHCILEPTISNEANTEMAEVNL